MKLEKLAVNHIENNLTVETHDPLISWVVSNAPSNSKTESFSIVIRKAEDGQPVWESGRVTGVYKTTYRCRGVRLKSDEKYLFEIKLTAVSAGESKSAEATGFFETGWLKEEEKNGIFIGETKEGINHLFMRDFKCKKKVKSAKLYVCGLGHFSCLINGKPATENVLEPGWSDYRKRSFYVAYDITDKLREGNNRMLFRLGDGMFHVAESKERYVYFPRSYGLPKLWVKLRLTFEDGRKEFIETDGEWLKIQGPDIYQEMYGGAYYDSRLMKKEYLDPDSKALDNREKASIVERPGGRLTAAVTGPLKVKEVLRPVSVVKNSDSTWLYDFGTNFSGWARIRIRVSKKSDKPVIMRPAEILKETEAGLCIDQSVTGKNYSWIYVPSEEKEQEYAPDFTYTGFRYLEVEGAVPKKESSAYGDSLPVIEEITGEFIYPDNEKLGYFHCSNELFNRIHGIVRQAILCNTKSYFTDCPHRERLGWLEQTHLIGPSILYNLDAQDIFKKIEQDMADSQHRSGLVPDICPEYVTGFDKWHKGFLDSPEWGSAIVINPWYLYRRNNDISLLEKFYGNMKRYVDYLTGKTHHFILHHGLGDWLDIGPNTPHSQNTPVAVVATCIYYLDVQIMTNAAGLLGKEADKASFTKLAKLIRNEYNKQFFDDQTGRYSTGSQAAQAMSLVCGLVEPKYLEKVIRVLRADIEKRDYAVTAGDVGHPFLIAALMKYGMSDLINKMTRITDHPGYGYQIENGATTLTEEWDGPDPKRPHGSQNHLMLGSVEEWFYGGLAGMEWIKGEGSWDQIRIKPFCPEDMEHVEAVTWHPNGKLGVSWQQKNGKVKVTVTVPFGVNAVLCDRNGREVRTVGSGVHEYEM